MPTLKLTLPQATKEYLAEQSKQGGFKSVADCVLDMLEKDRLRQLKKKIEADIREGLDSPSFIMTQEHWDKLDRTIARAAGKSNGKATKNKGKGLSRRR